MQPSQAAGAPPFWTRRTVALIAANTLAGFGAWIDFLVILAMAAYAYGADGFVMALVSALFLVPSLLLGPKLGRWLDAHDPGRAVAAGLALRAGATALLAMHPPLWAFCVVVALRSAVTVPVEPAFNVVVGRVVAKDAVPRYFGMLGLARNVAKIVAPALGTALASWFGDGTALGVSIALTLLALVVAAPACRTGVQPKPAAVPAAAAPASAAASAQGAADALDARLLFRYLGTVTVFAFVVFFVNNQMPVLLRDAGFDKALLGALVSCSGAGGIVAALILARTDLRILGGDPLAATTLAVIATAACFVALGLVFLLPVPVAAWAAGVVFFCTGFFASIEAIRSNTVIVQRFAARAGEVSGRVQAWTSAAMLVSPWVAALVIPYWSLSTVLLVDGVLGVVAVAVFASWARTPSPAVRGRGRALTRASPDRASSTTTRPRRRRSAPGSRSATPPRGSCR